MPLLRVQLNTAIVEQQRQELMSALSGAVAELLGKPESYVMVVVEPQVAMMMGGSTDTAAFCEVRSIGEISGQQAAALSARLSDLLGQHASIPAERIYTTLSGWPRAMWAQGENTFG